MKLSTRARYALRAMIAVARMSDGTPISLEKIAVRTRISKRYLEQLVVTLKNASLLQSVAGRHGGYLLARAPEQIPVGEIIEAGIGPINIAECVGRPEICLQADICECQALYSIVNKRVTDTLYEFTLADMISPSGKSRIREELQAEVKAGA